MRVAVEDAERLLERGRELSAVARALDDAGRGRGRAVLVEAPAGIGKTSLLRAASAAAAGAGFTCLRARAGELERDFAYGCVRQLLEPVAGGETGPDALFEGAAALARPLFAPAGAPAPSSPADSSFSMLHGLYWLLNNLAAAGPVALVVDDLHWSDAESLRFLNYLAPRLDGLPLAVLASARSGENVTPDLARLAAGPETTVLRPAPLTLAATRALSERALGAEVADDFAAACREATGGNPFFLEALLRDAAEQGLAGDARDASRVRRIGPAAVAQALLLRLSGRPPAVTALVRGVAVLGDGATLGEAAALAGIPDDEGASAADLLIALGILRAARGLEFAHPIVREAVYSDIGAHARAEAHARAAAQLAAAGAPEERIAAQIAASAPIGDPGRVDLLRRVAADALARGAPSTAAALLGRALAEPPPPEARGEVLLELGSAEYRLGAPEAADHLAQAVELITDPGRLATAARWLAIALTMSGSADRAVDALEAAVAAVEPEDRERALLLDAELAAHAQEARLERRAWAAERLGRRPGLTGATPGERLVLASLAFERAREGGSAAEAVGHLEGALAGGRLLGEQEVDVAGTFYLLLVALLATDALDVADACIAQALADARDRSSIPAMAYLIEFRGWVALRRGAVGDAEADARTALELLTGRGITLGAAYALALLVEALLEAGEAEEAARALDDSGLGRDIPPGMAVNDLLEARGLLRIAQGRTPEGLDDLLEFGRRDELWGGANPLASRWRSRASLALAALGEAAQARAMALDDLERARRWGTASGIGVALRACALAEGGDAAVPRLREAVAALEGSPARLEHARALVRPGRGAAARQPPRRRATRPGGGPRPRRALQRAGAGRARPHGAARRRGPVERGGRHGRRAADRVGAPRRRPRRRRVEQPRDRPGALRDPQDRRDPPWARLPQARRRGTGRPEGGPRRARDRGGGPRRGLTPAAVSFAPACVHG